MENNSVEYKEAFKNAILDTYPRYVKKNILKSLIEDNVVVDNKKKSEQFTINLNNSLDVSEYETINKKIERILEQDNILFYFEDFEFYKQYRHFCYFEFDKFSEKNLQQLVNAGELRVFDKKEKKSIINNDIPVVYAVENLIYLKFTKILHNEFSNPIKFTTLCIIDVENCILEVRFDKLRVAYKSSHLFYKNNIIKSLDYLTEKFEMNISNIDFKAVIEYIQTEKDDMLVYAKRMTRNGTMAYLEAFDDEESVMPILGELNNFINENEEIFIKDENTILIKEKLLSFIKEIDVKSDLPMVKVKMDNPKIKIGITHNYKESEISLFIFYGDLDGDKELMGNVKEYFIECYRELKSEVSDDNLSEEQN